MSQKSNPISLRLSSVSSYPLCFFSDHFYGSTTKFGLWSRESVLVSFGERLLRCSLYSLCFYYKTSCSLSLVWDRRISLKSKQFVELSSSGPVLCFSSRSKRSQREKKGSVALGSAFSSRVRSGGSCTILNSSVGLLCSRLSSVGSFSNSFSFERSSTWLTLKGNELGFLSSVLFLENLRFQRVLGGGSSNRLEKWLGCSVSLVFVESRMLGSLGSKVLGGLKMAQPLLCSYGQREANEKKASMLLGSKEGVVLCAESRGSLGSFGFVGVKKNLLDSSVLYSSVGLNVLFLRVVSSLLERGRFVAMRQLGVGLRCSLSHTDKGLNESFWLGRKAVGVRGVPMSCQVIRFLRDHLTADSLCATLLTSLSGGKSSFTKIVSSLFDGFKRSSLQFSGSGVSGESVLRVGGVLNKGVWRVGSESKVKRVECVSLNTFRVIKGIRVSCSGRVGGRSKKAQKAKTQCAHLGSTKLSSFSDKILFSSQSRLTRYGKIGVKVWVSYF